jgi:hypothetical protein
VAEEKRSPLPLVLEVAMDQIIGILGQVILILVAFACVIALVFFILVEIRAVLRVISDLRQFLPLPEPTLSANGKVEHPEQEIFGS